MNTAVKNLFLYIFIVTAFFLFQTAPVELIAWVKRHDLIVWTVCIIAWLGYSIGDRHNN